MLKVGQTKAKGRKGPSSVVRNSCTGIYQSKLWLFYNRFTEAHWKFKNFPATCQLDVEKPILIFYKLC